MRNAIEGSVRKLGRLGPYFLAIFAMSAAAVSPAQAADLFHAEKISAFYTANSTASDHQFVIPHSSPVTVKCTTVNIKGESKVNTTNDLTVHPEYGGTCKWNNLAAKINVPAACNFTLTLPAAGTAAEVDIVGCPSTAPITITTTGCIAAIANQNGLKSVTLANEGAGTTRDIKATINLTGISVRMATFGCPTAEAIIATASYTGTSTVSGYSDQEHKIHQGIWVE